MDTTDCLELPFPECDPPLVKDASDIAQFRDFAFAVDAAVQVLDDLITTTLLQPPAIVVDGGVNTAGRDIVQPLGGTPFYNNANMYSSSGDIIVIPEDGWYMVGGYVRTDQQNIGTRAQAVVNGDLVSAWQGPGRNHLNTGDSLNWNDMLFLRQGDRVTVITRHSAAVGLVVNYTVLMWAYQVVANV